MKKVEVSWGKRGSGAYTFASLRSIGVNLAFGSDTPVETMDPLAGIHAAVTRRTAQGEPPVGWYPEQRMSLEDAVAAYMSGCARAVNEQSDFGSIAVGKLADFVVLSRDIFSESDSMSILDARVDLTAVGGEIVFERGDVDKQVRAGV